MKTRENFETILTSLKPKIISYVNRRLTGYGEDIYNDIWVKFLELLREGRTTHPHPQRLVWSIAKNLIANEFRGAGRLLPLGRDLQDLPSLLPSPEDSALTEEKARLIRRGLEKIPRFDRNILEERYSNGTRALDIARNRGVLASVVRLQLYRARRKLGAIVSCRKEQLTA